MKLTFTKFLFFLLFQIVISVLPHLKSAAQNLITNGDFESGATGWSSSAGNGGVAVFTCPITGAGNIHAGTNAMRSNVTAVGANAWDVQTIQSGFTATVGMAHTLTFWAKASVAGRSTRIVLQNTTYTAQDFILTTAWAQYSFVFTPTEASLQLKIHYAQTGDFFYDDFVINNPAGPPTLITSTLATGTTYQDMVGFGGALTWYSERVIPSVNKTAIYDLMFTDLGIDIIRFKNWYYPQNYPTVKTTTTMNPTWFKTSFDATKELYTQAKARNPAVEILLCSWSPPQSLKSNGLLPEGTLKQNAGAFMYKEHGEYWADVLDNVGFNPDYISIQNEPGYVNPGWETCEWRPTETGGFPGYDRGMDSVWLHIKNRPNVPKVLSPETENIGAAAWNASLNTFRDMSTPIKTKPYLYGYAYHLYNYAGGAGSIAASNLNIVRDEFNNHPNFMTEFSSTNYNWIDVGRMIHANLVEANTSAYIYWELIWDNASSSAMIGMDNAGNYTVKDNYYTIKHFAKYVDKGYKRIAASGSNATLNVTAFVNPTGTQLTVVAINNHTSVQPFNVAVSGGSFSSAVAYQSVAGNYWQSLGAMNPTVSHNLPAKSITTYVLNVTGLPVELLKFDAGKVEEDVLLEWSTSKETDNKEFEVMHSEDGVHFSGIGKIPGAGSTTSAKNYSFLHKNPSAGKQYYQLRQEDYTGNSSYSPIREVTIIASSQPLLELFPVPFGDELTIKTLESTIGADLQILDAIGNTVYAKRINSSITQVDTHSYASGVYYVQLKSFQDVTVRKMIK